MPTLPDGFEVPIHRSLTEPILVAGLPRRFAILLWTPGMVIIHDCEGNYSGCWSYLASSASGVSAHYVVSSNGGEVSQLVREKNRAWHIAATFDCAASSFLYSTFNVLPGWTRITGGTLSLRYRNPDFPVTGSESAVSVTGVLASGSSRRIRSCPLAAMVNEPCSFMKTRRYHRDTEDTERTKFAFSVSSMSLW